MADVVIVPVSNRIDDNDYLVYMQILAIGHSRTGVLKGALVNNVGHNPTGFS